MNHALDQLLMSEPSSLFYNSYLALQTLISLSTYQSSIHGLKAKTATSSISHSSFLCIERYDKDIMRRNQRMDLLW